MTLPQRHAGHLRAHCLQAATYDLSILAFQGSQAALLPILEMLYVSFGEKSDRDTF
jgi:hypothetical protein